MDLLAIIGSERSELGVVVGLQFYAVLAYQSASPFSRPTKEAGLHKLTAPYLDTCRTKREASLKSGRGTIVAVTELESVVTRLKVHGPGCDS